MIARHNLSKVEILSGGDITLACERILALPRPDRESSQVECTWYTFLHEELSKGESPMMSKIRCHSERLATQIETLYQLNYDAASDQLRRHEATSGVSFERKAALVAVVTSGLLLAMAIAIHQMASPQHAEAQAVHDAISSHTELFGMH